MGSTIVGSVVGVVGLLLFVRGVWLFLKSRATRSWPSVPGEVITAMVERSVETDEDGTTTSYTPRTVYRYSVDGQQYTCDDVAVGSAPSYSSRTRAQNKLAYETGQKVTVYYNPKKPAKAVLEPGASRGLWSSLVFGVGFIIFGSLALAGYILP
jgi:hypothetical protein